MCCFSFSSRPGSAAHSPASHTHRCTTCRTINKKKSAKHSRFVAETTSVCVCVFAQGLGHDCRPPWEHERAHVEDTLQRQRREMQTDKEWLEQEERQLVGTHTYLCYVFRVKRTGHSFFICIAVESNGATKLTCQGTLAILFYLSASSKDTSVDIFDISAPLDCQFHVSFCLQNPLARQGSYVKVHESGSILTVTRLHCHRTDDSKLSSSSVPSSDFFSPPALRKASSEQ